jgi:hypothetical protein
MNPEPNEANRATTAGAGVDGAPISARRKSRQAPPRASAMIEALRGLGYSTAAALADIIDNSISARSDSVVVDFQWNGSASTVTVIDNGRGMDERELDRAMRLGERSPLDARAGDDLGRFGLGLKTASFSQCRRLTVCSRKGGAKSALHWDLDVLAANESEGWQLLEGVPEGAEAFLAPLDVSPHGTIVLWEKLDRIVVTGFGRQDFLDLIDEVEKHLAMVFHRFLAGPGARLKMLLNGRPVSAWDPFLASNSATWCSPIETLQADGGAVRVQCHVLPHHDHLSAGERESAAGPNGWKAQQGFYVYRNERMLVAGGWLGLGRTREWTREEAHRLARIRLDIPNTGDSVWKIDIRKSIARPPVCVRERLTHLAEDVRERARRVFAHRAAPVQLGGVPPVEPAWYPEHFQGGMRYRINRDHAVVKGLLEGDGDFASRISVLLRVLEETVPVQRIWLDTAEKGELPRTSFGGAVSEEVGRLMQTFYLDMLNRKGMSPELARERLLRTEPFNNYPALVAALPQHLPS